LPGARGVLFTAHNTTVGGYEPANIVVQPLPSGAAKTLVRGGYYARYVDSGHILYMHEGTLFAAGFDLDRLELTGNPVPAIEGVATTTLVGGAQFATARDGTLVYVPGARVIGALAPMFWMDRQGATTVLRSTAADWGNPAFSPDGRLLAIDLGSGVTHQDVWIYDWARDTLSRLTFEPVAEGSPVWTPDGRRIVFSRFTGSALNMYWQRADGSGDVQRLAESRNDQFAGSWHPSGRVLAFHERVTAAQSDVLLLRVEGDEASGWKVGGIEKFVTGPFHEFGPQFSPDGRWLAYVSNETGANEVYVRPFPGSGGKWQVSAGGGPAAWSRTASELFYRAPDGRLMVVRYKADGTSFVAEKPQVLADTRTAARPRQRSFDVHPDGQRFVMAPMEENTAREDKVVFVFNVFDELQRIAPTN
jgi:serine/threonine-protein kinase